MAEQWRRRQGFAFKQGVRATGALAQRGAKLCMRCCGSAARAAVSTGAPAPWPPTHAHWHAESEKGARRPWWRAYGRGESSRGKVTHSLRQISHPRATNSRLTTYGEAMRVIRSFQQSLTAGPARQHGEPAWRSASCSIGGPGYAALPLETGFNVKGVECTASSRYNRGLDRSELQRRGRAVFQPSCAPSGRSAEQYRLHHCLFKPGEATATLADRGTLAVHTRPGQHKNLPPHWSSKQA